MSSPPGARRPAGASRAERGVRVRRRRRAEIAVTLVVALAGIAYGLTRTAGAPGAAGSSPSPSPGGGAGPSDLLAFSLTGGNAPLVAVIGSGGAPSPAAVVFPPDLTSVVPGMAETPLAILTQQDARTVQMGVSNVLGTWVPHYSVLGIAAFGSAIERSGGLRVDLPHAVTVGGVVLGPGPTQMTGPQVTAYLGAEAGDTGDRWYAVMQAVMGHPPHLLPADFGVSDDAAVAAKILIGAKGGAAHVLPTHVVSVGAPAPDLPATDALMHSAFGVTGTPIPVIVQNGSGAFGVGGLAARRLIPAGFRITLSTNATSFDQRTTQVIALGKPQYAEALKARKALGLGRVAVSRIPSGLADVKIVIGKDFG